MKLIKTFVLILFLVVGGVYASSFFLKEKTNDKIKDMIIEKQLTTLASKDNLSQEQINSLIEIISDSEELKKVENLLSEHLDSSTLSKANEYINKADIKGLKKYIQSILSSKELKEIKNMYSKYKKELH